MRRKALLLALAVAAAGGCSKSDSVQDPTASANQAPEMDDDKKAAGEEGAFAYGGAEKPEPPQTPPATTVDLGIAPAAPAVIDELTVRSPEEPSDDGPADLRVTAKGYAEVERKAEEQTRREVLKAVQEKALLQQLGSAGSGAPGGDALLEEEPPAVELAKKPQEAQKETLPEAPKPDAGWDQAQRGDVANLPAGTFALRLQDGKAGRLAANERQQDVDEEEAEETTEESGERHARTKSTEDRGGRFDDGKLRNGAVSGKNDKSGGKRGKERGKDTWAQEADEAEVRPASFLPRKLYFENTYLGGDAAFQERVRRLDEALAGTPLPHRQALGYMQPFDPPEEAGLALFADVDQRTLERPGRVILQVGLQGSLRYGWRRPPLDVVLVLDGPAIAEDPEVALKVAGELLTQLGPQDHLGVVVSGTHPQVLAPLGRLRGLRGQLALAFDALGAPPPSPAGALADAMRQAGTLLDDVAQNRTTLPGTQTVLVVARGVDGDRVQPARAVAHELTLRGMVTSVIETGAGDGQWWAVNDAGYGNYHRLEGRDPREAVRAELESLSRVVARLARVNVRLAPNVHAIRILGSRVLDEQEVAQVKAREVAADQNISRTLGVKADRGDDDDGLQTVIPYFYGADSHVILIELWVDRPGPIADVTLRYKDMVNLGNATARVSVGVRNLPRDDTAEQVAVRDNARGFQVGESLERASLSLRHGDVGAARRWLAQAQQAAIRARTPDRQLVDSFASLLDAGDLAWDDARRRLLSESLFVAARRKVGATKALSR